MCGITGWIDWEEDLTSHRATIEGMAGTLAHRGPDAHGCWLSPRAALAHYRLFVIDPQGGKQPMIYQNQHQTYALTYNGEIYNFRELRSELEPLGHTFHTHSDTEVLLHAYIEWGEDCVRRLNGIFAFGLWDEQRQQLLLARDHLGVKPLFYAQHGTSMLFGSELKALLAHPYVKAEVDVEGMASVFAFRRTPGSGVFRNVYELRPGHMATFTRERLRLSRYWSLRSAPHTDDLQTTVEKLRALLLDTVQRQLIADVPVVTMISGGLDSSSLTALTAREFQREGKELHTYAIDFVNSDQHFRSSIFQPSLDAPWAKRVAEHVGSRHHIVMIDTPELIEQLLAPMRAHDLPAMGNVETSLYLLCKAMKEDATVAISGESADEVFGGYPWFHNEDALNAPIFPWLAMVGSANVNRQAMASWLSTELDQWANPFEYLTRAYQQSLAEVPHLAGEDAKAARIREVFYLNLTNYLPQLLDRKDRMSMLTGFEARVPFCDYRLVEYAWNIPWEMKTVGNIEKGILRRAMSGILPDDVLHRRKSGYPLTRNPTYEEELRKWVLQIVNDANAPVLPFVNVNLFRLAAEGKVPLPPLLHERVIQINAWLQEYRVSIVQ
ncbi:MAG TPA: asparagine synthase (glutamine-hydrolyzing) [Ktedonosporobacter sp.]|nr:asparagine synthase (glutamine-hydrolyzing) [Ktedonosporobacter sp.]